MTRKLVWTAYADDTLNDVLACLEVINPKGYSAADVKRQVQTAFDDGLTSYIGTAGWYVTVYQAPGSDTDWHCLPTLMAYSLKHYLEWKARP